MKPWFDFYPPFKEFEKNPKHFDGVVIEAGGFGLSWDDELDMDCTAIWDEGEIAHSPFDGLIALSDAPKLWELNESTPRKAIRYHKLIEGVDVVKFGGQWVVSLDAMRREYEEPKIHS